MFILQRLASCATLAGILIVFAAPVSAMADQILAAGNLFGGPTQTRVLCSFFNGKNTAIQVKVPRLIDQFGTSFPLDINQCDDSPTLAPLRSCAIAVNINDQRSWSCRARIAPDAEMVRGVLDLRNSSNAVLSSTDLR